jgi:hypothetical protein
MAITVFYFLEMSYLDLKTSPSDYNTVGVDVDALHEKKMEPLDNDRYTNYVAARGHLPMANHIFLASKLSNTPIRIPSGCVGKRHKGIGFLKRNDGFNFLTPNCKNNYNAKHYISYSFGLTNFSCKTCEGRA